MDLYNDIFHSEALKRFFSEKNTLQYLLLAEKALAQAQAENGIVPKEISETIGQYCDADLLDIKKLKHDIKQSGNAAIPLVKQLTQIIKNHDAEAAKYVHLGATSQDIVDTATVLQIKDFIDFSEKNLSILKEILIQITKEHRHTVMIGRTLLQQAKPITFGLKTAYWLEGIQRSCERLEESKKRVLCVQLSGAVGSQNPNISKAVNQSFAHILGLNTAHSWHTQRDNMAEFASILGILVGSLGKIAKDIILLMQTEVGEVFEGAAEGKGGSSTMPHKRNPVTSTAILANAQRVPFLVATILSAMPQEHERSAGLWHSEWVTLTDIMQLTAGSLDRSIELLSTLEIDKKRMLQNLELTNGLIYAENISLALAPTIGKEQAHILVETACKIAVSDKKHLKQVLMEIETGLSEKELDVYFTPENSIGLSLEIIDDIITRATVQNGGTGSTPSVF